MYMFNHLNDEFSSSDGNKTAIRYHSAYKGYT